MNTTIMPQERLGALRRLLREKPYIRVMEAHNGLTARIVETVSAESEGQTRSFDAMWVSSLCDSTAKGKPDIELVDFSSRVETIQQIMEVSTKPIILDGDTGGLVEHLVFHVRTLERLGVSAIIIEDLVADGPVITARANAYVAAGADGVMIHSKEKEPDEVMAFMAAFKREHPDVPVVLVPTSYNDVPEQTLCDAGASVIIHANHFIRSAYPAMVKTARSILEHGCSAQASRDFCMSIKEILTLIPDSLL